MTTTMTMTTGHQNQHQWWESDGDNNGTTTTMKMTFSATTGITTPSLAANASGGDSHSVLGDYKQPPPSLTANMSGGVSCSVLHDYKQHPPPLSRCKHEWGGFLFHSRQLQAPPPLPSHCKCEQGGGFVLFSVTTGPSLTPNVRGGDSYYVYISI
jgi:hypothetical protein